MSAYDDYLNGNLAADIFEEDSANKSMANLPQVWLNILFFLFNY